MRSDNVVGVCAHWVKEEKEGYIKVETPEDIERDYGTALTRDRSSWQGAQAAFARMATSEGSSEEREEEIVSREGVRLPKKTEEDVNEGNTRSGVCRRSQASCASRGQANIRQGSIRTGHIDRKASNWLYGATSLTDRERFISEADIGWEKKGGDISTSELCPSIEVMPADLGVARAYGDVGRGTDPEEGRRNEAGVTRRTLSWCCAAQAVSEADLAGGRGLSTVHASTPASRSTATSSVFSTPYTPSVYSIPADSPTNPLGLKRRVHNLTLPKPTPFSKHVALRFQLITPTHTTPPPKPPLWGGSSPEPGSSPSTSAVRPKNLAAAEYAREGTYRIVQAPLSYTFRHLRALILFLFSGEPSTRTSGPGHLFAVNHGITIGARGEITRGRVRVKLSRARDPYYSSRSLADLVAAADAQGQGEEDLEDEEEDASWRWEGEDDFSLGHVWESRSRDPKRGIIYVRGPL
ncbi:hypothetical protein BJV74DRAFT_796270 [Russula compacta]|nr:hypothetical protein BJV74DRAFT_796270 [Russula compacta]